MIKHTTWKAVRKRKTDIPKAGTPNTRGRAKMLLKRQLRREREREKNLVQENKSNVEEVDLMSEEEKDEVPLQRKRKDKVESSSATPKKKRTSKKRMRLTLMLRKPVSNAKRKLK